MNVQYYPTIELLPSNFAIFSRNYHTDGVLSPQRPHIVLSQEDLLRQACKVAKGRRLKWLWIEPYSLPGAQESLSWAHIYPLYAKASVCFVYLSDIEDVNDWGRSKWFQHTYTLPELVASKDIVFFTNTWMRVGIKSDLAKELSSITGIDEAVLRHREKVQSTSVAKRMSWASQRIPQKNREGSPIEEELAHCLVGIFHVPKLKIYSDIGLKTAMLLLQQEIMKEYPKDLSIFEWQHTDVNDPGTNGMLAGSPFQFRFCGQVETFDGGCKIELAENSEDMFSVDGLVISQPLDRIGLILNSYHSRIHHTVYPLILLSKEPPESRESTKVGCYRTDISKVCYISPDEIQATPKAQGLIYICKDGTAFFQGAASAANPTDLWGVF